MKMQSHFALAVFLGIFTAKRLTEAFPSNTEAPNAFIERHIHQRAATTRPQMFYSGRVTRQQMTLSRHISTGSSFVNDARNISRFKRLPESALENDKINLPLENYGFSKAYESRSVRWEGIERRKLSRRHAIATTARTLFLASAAAMDQDFLGSIHKDAFLRILNESSSITGSTRNSGRVSATEPYIDPATPHRVNAHYGNTTVLSCFVNNLGRHSVSWVRHQDIHVLTVGQFTFTNDGRFHSHHEDGSNEWALRLSSPNIGDTGFYECQVNTKPILVRLIYLKVYEPKAVISAGEELYLKLGSTIALQCHVTESLAPSGFVLWYHNNKVIGYGDKRTSINISHDGNQTVSIMTITTASISDSGTYSCNPSNAQDANVKVHVINGEHPAAMQTNTASRTQIQHLFWYFQWTALVFLNNFHKYMLKIGGHYVGVS